MTTLSTTSGILSKKNTVNIFLVYSPLHYLAAERIAAHFENGAKNYLYFLKEEFASLVNTDNWTGTGFLPWPRFYPERGLFGRLNRTRMNLHILESVCQEASIIRLHAPVIDTEAINYSINHLRKLVPDGNFSVRLIPDGVLNTRKHPLGLLKELLQYLRKLRKVFYPELNFYVFRGDRTGSDDPIVDRIYLLPSFPHKYNSGKVMVIPSLTDQQPIKGIGSSVPKALVIGQPLVAFNRMKVADVESVTVGLRGFITSCGIFNIDYKAHPKDRVREYDSLGYHDLKIDKPLEIFLAENCYDLIIGVCSTALLTARLILPKSTRVVAYGINRMIFRSEQDRQEILSPFQKLGVEIVDFPHETSA